MRRRRGQKAVDTPLGLAVVLGLVLWLMAGVGVAGTLSQEEAEALWEQLLQQERYQGIHFHSRSATPTVSDLRERRAGAVHHPNEIRVRDSRGGYLGGLFGLSYGGGWEIRGELEAEVPIEGAILQFYSKATTKWVPGVDLIFLEPRYDPDQYPQWEFRLVLRHASRRQEIRTLRSLLIPHAELIRPTDPRGDLRYDPARGVAIMQIRGLQHPITVEVPVPAPPFPDAPRQ